MGRFFEQIRTLWRGFTKVQKSTIIGGAFLSLIFLLFLIFYITKVEYVELYTDIAPEEAGRITSKFEEWKQPYKLKDTTIKVPRADRDRLRLKLAAANLAPTGGIKGWELFDAPKFTMTDYERRINYLRALQGELERTIETIEGIRDSRVLLVLPEKELFIEKETPVKASIKLTMDPYFTIDKEQVKGIINLVAFAVEGLSPNNITIVDHKGRILSEDIASENPDITTPKQLKLQEEERKNLERRIRNKLGNVIGFDKVEVIVKYELAFDRKETRLEKYSIPGFEQLKISEEKIDETFKGEGIKPEGQPGLESQIPGYKEIVRREGPVEYGRKEGRTNYYADKEETMIVKAPSVSKISVAVFVDGTYERDEKGRIKKDKRGIPIYIPRTNEEMEKIEKLVWAAIGAEREKEYLEREYIVEVENVQFDRTEEWALEERERAEKEKQTLITFILIGGGIILLILISLIILIRQLKKEERPAFEAPKILPPLAAQLEKEGIILSPEEIEALETARRKPELIAQLIRTWLLEEE